MFKSIITFVLFIFISCVLSQTSSSSYSQRPPENIYFFFYPHAASFVSFGSYNLIDQKQTIYNNVVPGTDNSIFYGIFDYNEATHNLLVGYYNASTETDNIGYYSVSQNQFLPPLYSAPHTISGYLMSYSPAQYDPETNTLFYSISNLDNNNATIFVVDFNTETGVRYEFPEQVGQYFPVSGVYNVDAKYYYTYYIDEDEIPNILVKDFNPVGNYSNYSFSDWNVTDDTLVYLLHTKNYVEGTTYALAIEDTTVTLYFVSLFEQETKAVLNWTVVPGSASITWGVPYSISSTNDYVVLRTNPTDDLYEFTTIDLVSLETSSFTTEYPIPTSYFLYSI